MKVDSYGEFYLRERHKSNYWFRQTTTMRMHHAFLYIFLPSLHDYNMKMSNFTFCGGREHKAMTFLLNGFLVFIVCLTIVTLILIATFQPHTFFFFF